MTLFPNHVYPVHYILDFLGYSSYTTNPVQAQAGTGVPIGAAASPKTEV